MDNVRQDKLIGSQDRQGLDFSLDHFYCYFYVYLGRLFSFSFSFAITNSFSLMAPFLPAPANQG